MDQLKIVAYGDSLTKGNVGFGLGIRYSPYTDFLQNIANEYLASLGSSIPISIDNMSEDGLLVGPDGLYDWPDSPSPHIHVIQVIRKKPDACIVLAGTNNLGYIQNVNEVAEYLFSLYRKLTESGVEPISVTVPPVGEEFKRLYGNALVEIRRKLNESIRQYSAENNMHCVDLFSATATPEGWMRPEYVSDGLHFNSNGYRRMAEVIFEQGIKPFLEKKLNQK